MKNKYLMILSLIYNSVIIIVSWFSVLLKSIYDIVPDINIFNMIITIILIVFHISSVIITDNRVNQIILLCSQIPVLHFWSRVIDAYPIKNTTDIILCSLLIIAYSAIYLFFDRTKKCQKPQKLVLRLVAFSQLLVILFFSIPVSKITYLFAPALYTCETLDEAVSPDSKYKIKIQKYSKGIDASSDILAVNLYENKCFSILICEFETKPQYLYSPENHDVIKIVWLNENSVDINNIVFTKDSSGAFKSTPVNQKAG